MELTIKLTADHLNVVLRHLDQGPHAQVRAVIDNIIEQVNAQQKPSPQPVEDFKKPEGALAS